MRSAVPYHPDQNLPWGPDSENVDAWIRPNGDLDPQAIRSYALTFGGYEYARQKDFTLAASLTNAGRDSTRRVNG